MYRWDVIKTWERKGGWYIHPDGYNYVKIGNDVEIGNDVKIGDDVEIGKYVEIGDGVKLGDYVEIGKYVKIGNGVSVPVYKSSYYAIHWFSPGYIRSGCIVKPFEWWIENVKRCAEEYGYNKRQQEQYAFFVDRIIAWEKAMGDLLGMVEKKSEKDLTTP